MKIKALPAEERPMEKALLHGVQHLSNQELIAIIINSGMKDKSAVSLAEEVVGHNSEGIYYLRQATIEELMTIKGIGRGKAVRILASAELGKRISARPAALPVNVKNSDDIAAIFMDDMRYYKKETFKTMLLNAKGDILSIETISVGELTSTLVHPREVFAQAVKKSAAAVVLVHNHPSGDPTPSNEDIKTTGRLVECGKLLGIRVLDHIIIGDGAFTSIVALGKM